MRRMGPKTIRSGGGSRVGLPLDRLYYLYEALVALNRPTINEPKLRSIFDFQRSHDALVGGALDVGLLDAWTA